jgi:hypothetical protein
VERETFKQAGCVSPEFERNFIMKKTLTALTILLAVSAAQANFIYWTVDDTGTAGEFVLNFNYTETEATAQDGVWYDDYLQAGINRVENLHNLSSDNTSAVLGSPSWYPTGLHEYSTDAFALWEGTNIPEWDGNNIPESDFTIASLVYEGSSGDKISGTISVGSDGGGGTTIANNYEPSFVVPEPATMLIFGLGGLMLNITRRRAV